jgi:hypothetical protein
MKDNGYTLVNVIWYKVPEFQKLWSQLDFDTKEDIIYTMAQTVEDMKSHKHKMINDSRENK